MYINMQNMQYNYNRQHIPYVEVISTNTSSDGTFNNLNDMFKKTSLSIKPTTDKERIFGLYKDCVYFGNEESRKLTEYIKNISVKEQENIFDYYD